MKMYVWTQQPLFKEGNAICIAMIKKPNSHAYALTNS
jgi:hypothetical protein